MAWVATWGFFVLRRRAARAAAAGQLRDRGRRRARPRRALRPPGCPMRICFWRSSAARFSAAAPLVLGPALGLRLARTGHCGRQRSEPVPAKGVDTLQRPGPLGQRSRGVHHLGQGVRRLPQVAVHEGHGDGASGGWVGELPGARHPGVLHQRGAVDRGTHHDEDALGGAERHRPGRHGDPGSGPALADGEGAREHGPPCGEEPVLRPQPLGPRRRTRAGRRRHASGRASCSGRGWSSELPSQPRPSGNAATAPSADRRRCPSMVNCSGRWSSWCQALYASCARGIGDLGEREEGQHPARVPGADDARLCDR